FEYNGPSNANSAIFIFGFDSRLFVKIINEAHSSDTYAMAGVITARIYRPWYGSKLSEYIPNTVRKIAVLEQIRKTTRWGPLLLDLLTINNGTSIAGRPLIVGHQ